MGRGTRHLAGTSCVTTLRLLLSRHHRASCAAFRPRIRWNKSLRPVVHLRQRNCALLSLNAKYLSISVIILYQCPTVYVEGEEYERERAIYETSNYVHRPREVSVYQAVYWFELHKAREGRFICQVVYRS